VRSHTDARARVARMMIAAVMLVSAAMPALLHAHQSVDVAAPTRAEINRALDIVKADPNLATQQTIKTLKWKNPGEPAKLHTKVPGWFSWVANFFRWLDQSARLLVWGAAILAALLLVRFIVRLVSTHGLPEREEAFVAPTHVRDLDIRPESLPADTGAAARAMWDRGEQRAALALLYRGMLSRLAHVHRMPIRDSTTEGDCLTLAAKHLTPRKSEYTSSLVRVWQRFVYGREPVQTSMVYMLCEDFAAMLDRGAALELSATATASATPAGGAA
jgi:hypothetical protein